MFRLLACLFFVAAVVAANPFVLTVLSEVSVDSSHQFVELHGGPDNQPIDLNGWQLLTPASACTLTHELQSSEYLVIDSEALALGVVGHGVLRLDPLRDSVFLLDDTGRLADWVCYPSYPTGHGKAPLPPIPGSIAFWNEVGAWDQSMNWYIDLTPTPGSENDDHSIIGGAVTGTDGDTLDEVTVVASGVNGRCYCGLAKATDYTIDGLGAGKYEVSVDAYHQGQPYQATYPESVSVGYAGSTSGINIVVPTACVAEMPSVHIAPILRVSGRALLLSSDGTAPVEVQLYSQVGSRVSAFDLGTFAGEKRIELPSTLAPGIYFALAQMGAKQTRSKAVVW